MPCILVNTTKKTFALDKTDEKTMEAALKLSGYQKVESMSISSTPKKRKPKTEKNEKKKQTESKPIVKKDVEPKKKKPKAEATKRTSGNNVETIFDRN